MADKPETFYDPSAADKEPEKRKPGRPPKAAAIAAEAAVEITSALTADTALAPGPAPQESETLDQAIARIGALRQKNRAEWGAFSQKLALPERNGYHRHWFNDVAGRIDEAVASGWSHVINPRDGKPLKRTVGAGRDNNPLAAYAMELPAIFWQEEMDARHKLASDRVDAIKKNPFQAKPGQAQASDKGKFYDPTEGGAGPLQVVKG
jgi:hypothetical protein